jgi:hypothetical protein
MRLSISAVNVDELAYLETVTGNIIDELKQSNINGVCFDEYLGLLRLEFIYYPQRKHTGVTEVVIAFPNDDDDIHNIVSQRKDLALKRIRFVDIDGAAFSHCAEFMGNKLRQILSIWKGYRYHFHTDKKLRDPEEQHIQIWEYKIFS